MKKLNLDALEIESFVTGTANSPAGPTTTSESVIRCSGNCPSAACSDPYC